MSKLFIICLISLMSGLAVAQSDNFSILYEITELNADEVPMLGMLKGSTIEVAFSGGQSKTDINIMFGMIRMQMFGDKEKKENAMYFDMMGQKKFATQPMQENGGDLGGMAQGAGMGDMELVKANGKSKKIAGYKSTPYELKGGDSQVGMKIYITKKLQPSQQGTMDLLKSIIKMPDIKGFPMMLELSMEGIGLTIEAKQVNQSVDKNTFARPTGYKEASMEDILGGLGGGMGGFDPFDAGSMEEEEEETVIEIADDDKVEELTIEAPPVKEEVVIETPIYEVNQNESAPEYPGGESAMMKFIGDNITYPASARKKGVEGTVVLSFIVEKDGSISNITIEKGVGEGCSEEAVRVVQKMPKWKPGSQDGEAVRVKYTLPVKFKLT